MKRTAIGLALAGLLIPLAGACAQQLPSRIHHAFVDGATGRVEYYWIDPATPAPWPAVVVIHGHQDGASTPGGKQFVDFGALDSLATQGYVGVAVSQPGYGQSTGPADFMGPRTLTALEAVIHAVRARPEVRADRVALEGVSRGAIVAALEAARDSTIRAMVLISGVYDFLTLDPKRLAVTRDAMIAETGGSPAALRARSAALMVERIRTPALVLNGAQDDRTDPEQGRAFAAALAAHGVDARVIIYPQFGHAIGYPVRERDVKPFLARWLK